MSDHWQESQQLRTSIGTVVLGQEQRNTSEWVLGSLVKTETLDQADGQARIAKSGKGNYIEHRENFRVDVGTSGAPEK